MNAPRRDDVVETELELIDRAQTSVSDCNWIVGECAAKWTRKYAKGRTDADFAALVGLTSDQVYQRRRVWETFGDVSATYPSLKWSHFYVATTWDDAPECLQWAEENQATVAEMKTWRRVQRGEDLSTPAEEPPWGDDELLSFVPSEPTAVRVPGNEPGRRGGESGGTGLRTGSSAETVPAFARESDAGRGDDGEASLDDATSSRTAVAERPSLSAEQLVKRMTTALERMHKSMDAKFAKDYARLPKTMRTQFAEATARLSERVGELE